MKRLKIILQHNIFYYVVLLIAFVFYFVSNNIEHVSIYKNFNNKSFIITNIIKKDYGIKLELKGKEKVIGYLYNTKTKNYSIGDKVSVTGEIQNITNNTVPNTFNYKKYLETNKTYNVIEITKIKIIKKNKNILWKAKTSLIKRGEKLKKSYPYINSLIFGDNSYIDEDIINSYRQNGISHLFAISGLHIAIFIGLITFILNKLKLSKIIKSIIIIIFLIFYMFITNYSMSVERSAIFTILLLINKVLKLEISNINILLLTLSIILFINPLNWNNIGLKYSFLVALGLLKYTDLITGSRVAKAFKTSLIAFLISYPITVNNFYEINFISILYNILFVPYVSVILLPLTILSYIFPILDNVLFFFIRIIEIASRTLTRIDALNVNMCKISKVFTVVYFVIIYWVFSRKNTKASIIILILFFTINHYSFPKTNYIMFMDVGQGDSTIINIKNKSILIDTGGITSYSDKPYEYKISKNKTIPYLKANGIKKINELILTHGDFDHMGEAKYLVENFKVEKVIFNCGEFNALEKELIKVLDRKRIKYYSCIKELNIDNHKLYFLQTKEYDNENDNSNVIYAELNGYKFMLMGDASTTTEKEVLSKYNLPNIDVLKVGHHGSKTSSGKEFIDEISPRYSIISVGKNNRYGHPNKEVLSNLEQSKIYRTDQDGSIIFKIKNNKLKIETYSP